MSIDEVRALAERYLPSFLAGERAPADLYAEKVVIWHNIGEHEEVMSAPPSFARAREVIADLRREDVSVDIHERGFVIRATTCGTAPGGSGFRIPAAVFVTVEGGRITRFDEYADGAAAAPLLKALKPVANDEIDAYAIGLRDELVSHFTMVEVERRAIGDVGSFGVWGGEVVGRLVHVSVSVPGVVAHMLVAQTPGGSPVPHLAVDLMRFPSGFGVFVDLLPRVDLVAHKRYADHVYRGLDEVTSTAMDDPAVSVVPMPPSMLAFYSPWMIHHTGSTSLEPIATAVRAFTDRFIELCETGVEAEVSPAELAERDRRHRAVLFDPDFDPVWRQVEPLLGVETVTYIRETLGAPL